MKKLIYRGSGDKHYAIKLNEKIHNMTRELKVVGIDLPQMIRELIIEVYEQFKDGGK